MLTGRQFLVLKAAPNKLFALLECVYDHPYDRDGFRDSVLSLSPVETRRAFSGEW